METKNGSLYCYIYPHGVNEYRKGNRVIVYKICHVCRYSESLYFSYISRRDIRKKIRDRNILQNRSERRCQNDGLPTHIVIPKRYENTHTSSFHGYNCSIGPKICLGQKNYVPKYLVTCRHITNCNQLSFLIYYECPYYVHQSGILFNGDRSDFVDNFYHGGKQYAHYSKNKNVSYVHGFKIGPNFRFMTNLTYSN